MHHSTRSIGLLLLAAIVVLPSLAEARAGGGSSFGSRGSRTYQSTPYSAQSLSRSTAARPSPSYNRPYTPYAPAAPYGSSHPFLSSLAGGFLGAGLFHMFTGGGGGYGYGGGIGGSGISFLEILLLGWLGYYLFKRMQRGSYAYASGPALAPADASYFSPMQSASSAIGYNGQAPDTSQTLTVTESDKQAFAQLLQNIQLAWSSGDLSRMRQYATPEMIQYFSEELSADASRGLANKVEQVTLESAEVVESWSEYNLDYATARMRWSSLDYMVRLDRSASDADYIASGDSHRPQEAEEYWTFTRSSGGHWLLSAIQQR